MNNRKRKVLESCLQLFTHKGFHNTSIQDILQHAQISKGTFYNYFASKNECFLAILENRRYEASIRRFEILEGQDKSDLNVLAEQVAVLMRINKEQNLIALFEGVFNSTDEELKSYLAHHRLYEIQWLMERLIDIYGEQARPYTYEAAVLFFAMIHHLSFAFKASHETTVDALMLAQTGLRHIDAILPKMIERGEALLTVDSVPLLEAQLSEQVVTVEKACERLAEFIVRLKHEPNDSGEQLGTVILEELQSKSPRFAVIEVLLKPFREAFKGTSHELESRQLVQIIWQLCTQNNNRQA